MHIEKNVCESVIKFIFGLKDTIKVRRDMEVCGIREHLWLKRDPQRPGKIFKPVAPYVLRPEELQTFMNRLASLKVPTDYCGSLGKHIMDKKLGLMKSHDWHVLMQQLMPLALRGLMGAHVRLSLMRLSRVYRNICAKVWDPIDLPTLREDVAITFSMLEWEFPGAFFDVMSHLTLHIVEELDICGPVHTRWMYPIERAMKVFKGYVRNRSRPEASMAEGYILDETIGFVTEYLQDFRHVRHRIWDADEEEGVYGEVVEGAATKLTLDPVTRDVAHQYVITNVACLAPWVRYTTLNPLNPCWKIVKRKQFG
jgi:hypothetical protein